MAGSSELLAAEAAYRKEAVARGNEKAPLPWYAAAVLLFSADRLFKTLALSDVSFGTRGIAEFTLFMNEGIAFSIPVPDAVFWPAAVVALTALCYSYVRTVRNTPVTAAIVAIILLGALSNLHDRIMHDATVDYLLFFGRSAVNIADGMIVGGLVALFARNAGKS